MAEDVLGGAIHQVEPVLDRDDLDDPTCDLQLIDRDVGDSDVADLSLVLEFLQGPTEAS